MKQRVVKVILPVKQKDPALELLDADALLNSTLNFECSYQFNVSRYFQQSWSFLIE